LGRRSQREGKKFPFRVAAVSGKQKSYLFMSPQSAGSKKVSFSGCRSQRQGKKSTFRVAAVGITNIHLVNLSHAFSGSKPLGALGRKTSFSTISPTLAAILSPQKPKPYSLINKVEGRAFLHATKVWKKKNNVIENCIERFTNPAGWHVYRNEC
jgi:hypothetical protein